MTAPTPQQIAETLAEHGALGYDDVDGCECGVEVRTHEAHRVHVAEQLAALWPQPETSTLRALADDSETLWTVARRAIEDALIEWRDSGLMMPQRNNGFVVRWEDGKGSDIIRFGPETGVRIALLALADHIDAGLWQPVPADTDGEPR